MSPGNDSDVILPRIASVPRETFKAVAWIGPMLMVLAEAIGSGEILAEPVAGARYGGALLWVILFTVLTKAFWNEAVGRVSLATGQNFLEVCSGAGPGLVWVSWAWYAVNVVKDFLLRGGLVAIAGLICYETFGALPTWLIFWWRAPESVVLNGPAAEQLQGIAWTFLNFAAVWIILTGGGYRLSERINTVLCIVFTLSLLICALMVFLPASGELARGLVPRRPSSPGELLMIVSLTGIVMSGSGTIRYSAWAEEREMGLLGYARRRGRRIRRDEFQPRSDQEVGRMLGWLRVNRVNIILTYCLGTLICLSTFVLGVAVLRPAGVELAGARLAHELSLMMTEVLGPWARALFYAGTWAAIASTAISIFDGASRMYIQPLRLKAPGIFAKLSFGSWQKILITLMMIGSWSVYRLVPEPTTLVIWLGAIDAPLVGVLIVAYAYLGRFYIPQAYRTGALWSAAMLLIGLVYVGLGVLYGVAKA